MKRARLGRAPSPVVVLIAGALTGAFAAAPPALAQTVSASFTYTPKAPLSLWQVHFSSTSTAAGEGNEIDSHVWDMDGDGSYEGPASATASRSFPRPGSYQVGLRVFDTEGNSSDAVATVRVGNRRPVASIARFPEQPHTGEAVTFFSTSVDQDGSIQSQAWDLDGDGFDDGRRTLASRSFPAAGVYTVRMRATDDQGSTHEATHTFAVTDPPGTVSGQGAGAQPPRLLSPFPIVRISGNVRRRGTRLRLLTVQAPAGASVVVSCTGRGCPFRRRGRSVSSGRRGASPLRFRQFRRRLLRPDASVRVYVSSTGAIGKYTRFRIRRGKPPARADRCLAPGARKPQRCPAGG